MLDEQKNGGDGKKAEPEKKPRNGKIENADIRENAEVSHAWGKEELNFTCPTAKENNTCSGTAA